MKTAQEIEKDLIQDFVARQNTVTHLSVGSVIRGFFTSTALSIAELYYQYTAEKRKLFLDTASGADLDRLADERGLTRRGSSKAGALLLLRGPSGTVVPAGTVCTNPTSNLSYVTQQDITLGDKNPGFVLDVDVTSKAPIIGDIVWAECSMAGTIGRTPADTITRIAISNVSVTNLAPAQGGTDGETDDEFRYRIKNYVKLLNKNTQKFYETLAQDLDERIQRVLPEKDYSRPDSILLTLVTKSGAAFSPTDLNLMQDLIRERQHSFAEITCKNEIFQLIELEMNVKLKSINNQPVDFDKYFLDAGDILSKYFDWSKWPWGGEIRLDNVFAVAKTIPQTDVIDLQSFKLNGSTATKILLAPNCLPYFKSIKIINTTGSTPVIRSNTNIKQSFENS